MAALEQIHWKHTALHKLWKLSNSDIRDRFICTILLVSITHKCMKQNGLSKCGAWHICKRATLKNLQKACAAYWLTFDPFCFHLHCSLGSYPTLQTCLSACLTLLLSSPPGVRTHKGLSGTSPPRLITGPPCVRIYKWFGNSETKAKTRNCLLVFQISAFWYIILYDIILYCILYYILYNII